MTSKNTVLNGISPYFTMFPLRFPYGVLDKRAQAGEWVLDPFCGRGTTNYASRLLGLPSVGMDSSPVAVALARAKLANTSGAAIYRAARRLLDEVSVAQDIPQGPFWKWAFHRDVLSEICRLREGLLDSCRSEARKALRAVIMGALHGPMGKVELTYFSNQSPRTYAPKPAYAVRFWKARNLRPPRVDVLDIIRTRAQRYFSNQPRAKGYVILGDSRLPSTFRRATRGWKFRWLVTSPPYYGMRTYIPDQWLRNWFVGGPAQVDYSNDGQLDHGNPTDFAGQLHQVWCNAQELCKPGAHLVIRFGGINDRRANPRRILVDSLCETGWRLVTVTNAGTAEMGKRQAATFVRNRARSLQEHDFWAIYEG